jgi:hypothetical protein
MGAPSQTIELPGGQRALYFSRLPEGRMMFVATVDSDGILRTLDQRLTRQNMPGSWRGLPPGRCARVLQTARNIGRYPRLDANGGIQIFDYGPAHLTVQFSSDGTVRGCSTCGTGLSSRRVPGDRAGDITRNRMRQDEVIAALAVPCRLRRTTALG